MTNQVMISSSGLMSHRIKDKSPMVAPGEVVVIEIHHEPKRSRWESFKAHFRKRPKSNYPDASEEAFRFVSNAFFITGFLLGCALGFSLQGFF